jgi:hypothetical protein
MKKQELENQLSKIELVKPSSIEGRLSNEVESLCEFTCTGNTAKGAGDTEEENDILF